MARCRRRTLRLPNGPTVFCVRLTYGHKKMPPECPVASLGRSNDRRRFTRPFSVIKLSSGKQHPTSLASFAAVPDGPIDVDRKDSREHNRVSWAIKRAVVIAHTPRTCFGKTGKDLIVEPT